MSQIVGLVTVTVAPRKPAQPGAHESREVALTGHDFGLEDGEGETFSSISGMYVAFAPYGIRVELNLDVESLGAFRDPVDISELAEVSCTDVNWKIIDVVVQLEVMFGQAEQQH